MRVPAFKYYFPQASIEWITTKIRETLESGDFLTLGKYCREFENQFANYIGSKYAVATSSGTASLEIIMRALSIQGCEVIVPTNTFAATAYGVIHAGGRPVFVDIAFDLNFDVADVKKKITSKTKAIVPVHIGGLISQSMPELLELAEQRGLYVVEDAAHAHGSTLKDKKAGSFGIAGSFSFFSTKVITSSEGGMITTNDSEIAQKARLLRDQGKVRGNLVGVVGYNWRLSELQAIVGLAQLRLIEEIIEKRTQIAKIYDELLRGMLSCQPLQIPSNARSNYYKYIAFLPRGREPEVLKKHLAEKYGVELGGYVYEVPLHNQPVFKEYVDNLQNYPIADDLCTRHIALPDYPSMTSEEAKYVAENLKSAIKDLGWM